MIAYPFEQSLSVDFYSTIHLISIFIGCLFYAYFFKAVNTKKDFTHSVSINYLLLIITTCLLIMSPLIVFLDFSFVGFRSFYHEYRANNFYSSFYYLITMTSPLLGLLAFYKRKYFLFIIAIILVVISGKKQVIFNTVFFMIAYYELVRRGRLSEIKFPIFLSIFSLLLLQVLFSTASLNYLEKIGGYFDIYINMSDILSKIQFGEFSGSITLSNFWSFIPRFLYESKPEIYGTVLIHEAYYPRELMVGYTRGIFSPIIVPLADGGVLFLILISLLSGIFSTFCFYQFKRNKDLFWFVLFLTGFNLIYVFLFAPYMLFRKLIR